MNLNSGANSDNPAQGAKCFPLPVAVTSRLSWARVRCGGAGRAFF